MRSSDMNADTSSGGPDSETQNQIQNAKVHARAHARGARAKAYALDVDAGRHVRDLFLKEILPRLKLEKDAVVASYISIHDELDTRPLLTALEERGFRPAAPCIVERDRPLVFRAHDVFGGLVPGKFGSIPEPPVSAPELEPDLLLVPLLAFNRSGHRLGYGRGYYDRTLESLRKRRVIVAVGLAFAAQEMLSLPVSDNDQRLDWIVTEKEVIRPAP
jgi:5-formyltetrahydrofolate cyclo-ligase